LKQQQVTFSERIGYGNRVKLMERQSIRHTDRILDFGCGAGLFVNFLRERGFGHVSGYDPFVSAWANTKTLEQTYDVVVSYDVIEHHDDPREFLVSLDALLRAGGLLVIGTPNADRVSLDRKADPSLHTPYHRHILSERVLLALAGEQGMEPVHIYRRSFYDSLIPTVNSRFMWEYIRKSRFLDAAVEPPKTGLILRSPKMVFLAFFGYFLPAGDNIIVSFRKRV
jgi:SAM-dependent methyltransferase